MPGVDGCTIWECSPRCRQRAAHLRQREAENYERARAGRPFELRFRNAISAHGRERRFAADVAEARALARDHRPWNNTAVVIVEIATGAHVPVRGDRCVCCRACPRDHRGEPRPHADHYTTACAVHPELTDSGVAVAPYRTEVPACPA